MKLRQIAILILLTVAALLAAIHPPNPNTECARPGCGHRQEPEQPQWTPKGPIISKGTDTE
jgi:hypothetical protein